jgi:predicted TIM-barrel fold metal-dependent hydrolase
MEIIDAHTNLYYPGEHFEQSLWPTFEAKVAVLREAGVSRALASRNESVEGRSYEELLDWNRRIVEACEASDGLYFPSAIVQPEDPRACELLRRCREDFGMRFVGEMFDRWLGYEWGTPEYYRLLECAVELRIVPLIHCEDEVVKEIGERYPEGKFLIAHLMGAYERRIETMAPYPHLYLDISGSDVARAGAIGEAVAGLGVERVVFGSDLSGVDPVIAVMCVKRSGLTEEQQRMVFAENFKRLWEWTEG